MFRSFRALLFLILVLALPTLACGLTGGAEPTAAPAPTEAPVQPTDTPQPQPTATEVPSVPTDVPTEVPEVEPTATLGLAGAPTKEALPTLESDDGGVVSDIELDSTPYTQPDGSFALNPPLGWDISNDEGSASIEAPDGTGFIYVQVTDTGYGLDADAFTSFVENRDLNFFTGFDDYVEVAQEVDTDTRVASVTKNLTFDGVPQTVISLYDQYDAIIYTYDFWSDDANVDAYSDLYSQVVDTIQVNTSAAAEQTEYNWVYTFTGPSNLFTIEVPTPWRYERTEGDNAMVDTFYSPDEHAIIQNIAYDDGTETSRSQAGAFALELLRSYYATDIRIQSDQVQPDGSERLIWSSPSGDYSGTSFLETRGTTFLLFTTMYDNPYEDYYLETLNYTIGTYEVPES
ncbi:MAG TPA: hypothetical protein VE553_06920 [Candidatus Binatia bacterium]|nr:hypothetical protein [Candidatus Binatia bacterium]